MNENNKTRSPAMPILCVAAIVAAAGLGIYFWPPAESSPDDPPKKPAIVKKDGEPEKNPPQGKNGEVTPKVLPAEFEPAPPSLAAATEFLLFGPQPVQVGVDPKALDARRTAALRGLVFKKEKTPFPGVHVSIQNQPRYGVSHTRADGSFDMVVNGGGLMTVGFTSKGYLPVWRPTAVPWQEYTWLSTVFMTEVDSQVTPIKGADKTLQIARATKVKDKDGERQPTVVFQGGTTATMVMPDGSNKELASLNVRATEYTAGEHGRARMPAPLPANVAYTYCVELSDDEAIKAGARTVRFNKPVYHYVENFLNFPVGIPVPTGYFDPQKGAWIAGESGRVIKILDIMADLASLDVAGKGKAATAQELKAINLGDDERRELAKIYAAGVSVWRVPIPHFSIWACGWSFGPPPGASSPLQPAPEEISPDAGAKPVQETVSIPGSDWKLHYRSDRTPGGAGRRGMRIPLTSKDLSKDVKEIELEVLVAGRRFAQSFAAAPDLKHTFTWDGRDAFGRIPQGAQTALVRIGYVYDGVYRQNARFGVDGDAKPIAGSRTRETIVLWQEHQLQFGGFDARSAGLGGWSLEGQHAYDPAARVLYMGNGERQAVKPAGVPTVQMTITTVAGGGVKDLGDGGPAVQARLDNPNPLAGAGFYRGLMRPRGLAVGPDGSIFIADANDRIRRVDPRGAISTIAGGGNTEASDGLATDLNLHEPRALALGPDGSVYIAEVRRGPRVRRLAPDGTLTTIVGGNLSGSLGDGGPAHRAQLQYPTGLAVAKDGTLYIADQAAHKIRRVTPDGIITTVAGTGNRGFNAKETVAAKAQLFGPTSLALGPDGSLYFSDLGNYVVRRIDRSGTIKTVAGMFLKSAASDLGAEGGPALQAKFNDPTGLAVAADGALYIADTRNHRIRCVGADGVIRTVAGTGPAEDYGDFAGDQGPPQLARLSQPTALALGPDGSLYCYDAGYQQGLGNPPYSTVRQRIRRISPPADSEIVIPSPDGKELFGFNALGQHLETRDAATKKVRIRFEYDKAGRLEKVEDALGHTLKIERDAKGKLQGLVTQQKTAIELNGDGFLATLTSADGATTRMSYASGGLLKDVTRPTLTKSK